MKQAYHRSGLWINESQPAARSAVRASIETGSLGLRLALAFLDPKVVGAGAAWKDTQRWGAVADWSRRPLRFPPVKRLQVSPRSGPLLSGAYQSSTSTSVGQGRVVLALPVMSTRVLAPEPVSSPAAGSYNLRTPYSGPDGAAVTDVQLKSGGVQPNSPAPYRARVKRERPPRPGHHDTHPYTERTTAKARRGIFQPCLAVLPTVLVTGLDSRLDSTV